MFKRLVERPPYAAPRSGTPPTTSPTSPAPRRPSIVDGGFRPDGLALWGINQPLLHAQSPCSDSSAEDTEGGNPFLSLGRIGDTPATEHYGRTATYRLAHALGVESLERELSRVQAKRTNVWKTPEWEVVVNNSGQRIIDWSIWPEDDLALSLIDAYFEWVNITLPLLHRPLFRQQYFARLYMNDFEFAKVCLMVFANGARFMYAPLAQWRRHQDSGHLSRTERPQDGVLFSDGWKFVRGLMSAGDHLHKKPTLYRLQTAVLLCTFLQGNAEPNVGWAIAGAALRSTQETGLPVQTVGGSSAERQLLLRAFWCLYHCDRSGCVALGRAVALADSEIDTRYPMVLDDDDSDAAQSKSPTSPTAVFMHVLELDRIVSSALSALCSARQDPSLPSRLPSIVLQLVAAINRWESSLPTQLAWDPECRATPQLVLTAHLHARYHWARMFIHYISATVTSLATPAPQSTEAPRPMIAAALESARRLFAICRVLLSHDAFLPATQRPIPINFIDSTWIAGTITLLGVRNSWMDDNDVPAALDGVKTAVAALHQMECVSRKAGITADILQVLASNAEATRLSSPSNVGGGSLGQLATGATPVAPQPMANGWTPDLAFLSDPNALFLSSTPHAAMSAAADLHAAGQPQGEDVWTHLLQTFS